MNRWKPLLEKEKKEYALDIGCGIGLDTRYLTEFGYKVISMDLSETALSICKKTLPDNVFLQIDIGEGLPFSTNSFQVIVANLSLHYFDSVVTEKIMDEIRNCLKTGALFFVRLNSTKDINFGSVGHEEIEPSVFRVENQQKRFFDGNTVNELFKTGWKRHGIEEISIDRYSKTKVVWEVIAEKA